MEREFFFPEDQEELAQSVCATLSETSGTCWRMERWGDNSWHVVRETTEDEIRWLAAGVGDMSDWLRLGAEHYFTHADDTDLPDPGDEMADSRTAEVSAAKIHTLPTGDMATFTVQTGKCDTRRQFLIQITEIR